MYKIMLGAFSHETNSFSSAPADLAAFRKRRFYFGEEMLEKMSGDENEINGYLAGLQQYGDEVQLIPSIAFSTGPSGPVTQEVYEIALSEMKKVIREQGPFHGLLLNMHGAMVSEGHPDAEGDFLEELRNEIGDIPVVVTLDLHANITKKMGRYADALICCEKYPHTDCFQLGRDAAELMMEILHEGKKPIMEYRRIPFLLPLFPTNSPEIQPYVKMASDMQGKNGVRFVRIAHGFFPANIPEMGMSVVVISFGDPQAAKKCADQLETALWNGRNDLHRSYTSLEEAFQYSSEELGGPIVMGDGSDNPGAGGLCDTTHVLRYIMENDITGAVVAVIRDPESVKECFAKGIGAEVSLLAGGMSDERISGGPVPIRGTVINLTDGTYRNRDEMEKGLVVNMGPTAVVSSQGNLIILTTERCQVLDAEGVRSCGIEPESQKFIIVKSAVHYRQSFGKFAGKLVDLALPGFCAPDPALFEKLGFPLQFNK